MPSACKQCPFANVERPALSTGRLWHAVGRCVLVIPLVSLVLTAAPGDRPHALKALIRAHQGRGVGLKVAAPFVSFPRRHELRWQSPWRSCKVATQAKCYGSSHGAQDAKEAPKASWLPSDTVLRELAAGNRPVCFFCLRQAGGLAQAACACEVRTEDTSLRAFHLFAPCQGGPRVRIVKRCEVHELSFSEGKHGGHIWDGGVLMAAWATTRAGEHGIEIGGLEFFENKRVLELGAGMGVLGIALASCVPRCFMVLTDFGYDDAGTSIEDNSRLVPPKLLQMLRQNVAANKLSNAEVQHLDWHSFLPPTNATGGHSALPRERFERVVGADVVYYTSDLPALAAATAAHLVPGGLGFFLVPKRVWTGPLAGERASSKDLVQVLSQYGQVSETELIGHCGSLQGEPVALVQIVRGWVGAERPGQVENRT